MRQERELMRELQHLQCSFPAAWSEQGAGDGAGELCAAASLQSSLVQLAPRYQEGVAPFCC